MKINSNLKNYYDRLEKIKENEKIKIIDMFNSLLDKYPIYEIINSNELRRIIIDIYNQRKQKIIKIELEEEKEKSHTLKNIGDFNRNKINNDEINIQEKVEGQ